MIDVTPQGLRFDPAARGNKRFASIAVLLVVLALGWYFQGQPAFRPQPAAPPPVAPDAHSIAVLPFVNLSPDREQAYFSDGLSEELLNMLGQVPQLRVIARTSSFSFKDKTVDVATIARALNVASVLEGSVRKSGNTLRISAQLVRASDSTALWSAIYDREITDVFKVQDEIAAAVVAALKVKLLPAQRVANPHRTADAQAYTLYLRGNEFFNRASADGYRRAVEAYRQAIALDPGYAAAYAGLAVAEVYDADSAETTAENDAAKQRGLAAADKAIALAPGLADGYTARGWMRSNFTWEWTGAQADLERALAIDPSNSTVQRRYGQLLASQGRMAGRHRRDPQVGGAGSAVGTAVEQPRLLPGRRGPMGRSAPGPEACAGDQSREHLRADQPGHAGAAARATPIPPWRCSARATGRSAPTALRWPNTASGTRANRSRRWMR